MCNYVFKVQVKLSFVSIFSFSIYHSFFQSWSGLAVHKEQKSPDQCLVYYFKEKIKCWCLVGAPQQMETQDDFLSWSGLWVSEWVKSLSRVRLFATPWTVAHRAPPSMGFSRQEYWSGLPFPSPGDLPDPGMEPRSPALQAEALTSEPKEYNVTVI